MQRLIETNLQEFPNFVIFKIDKSKINVDVLFENETLWLTQKKMAELFETTPQNITLHLKNIYKEEELFEDATCKEFLQVQQEGNREVKRKSVHHFGIDYFDEQLERIREVF
ncbi:MAG: hypothetical protein L3J19_03945 [Sulfurimonas sp.]|nr:hypothetical protein [Sulfurimonas sp.]